VLAEKNLSWKDNCERHNNHHTDGQSYQSNAAAPPEECTGTVRAATAKKPATQNDETKEQQYAVSNPYRAGLANVEHVHKNEKQEHNNREEETGLPGNPVAKNPSGKLHKTSVNGKTDCYENEPWNNH
jgi:hypothetical protein